MKKLIRIMMVLAVLGLLAIPLTAILYAVPTCTLVETDTDGNSRVLSWQWATGNTLTGITCPSASGSGYVVRAVTDPGALAPTDNYDIVVNDANSVDVMGGLLENRDTANSEQIVESAVGPLHTRFNGAITPVFATAGTLKYGTLLLYIQR